MTPTRFAPSSLQQNSQFRLLWIAIHKRRNFLFADTPAGAEASALIYSLIESARANGHEPRRYLTIALAELPGATRVEQIEALLPWNVTVEEIGRRYAGRPKPAGWVKKASP